MSYKKCPKCELNYILEGEELCSVCKKCTYDTEDYLDDDICPVCGINRIKEGDIICEECRQNES